MTRRFWARHGALWAVCLCAIGCSDADKDSSDSDCDLAPELCDDDAGGSGNTNGGGEGGDPGPSDEGGGTGGSVGDIDGMAGVYIVELGCQVVWNLVGPPCAGCDLGWDVDLLWSETSTCPFGDDTSGTFEVTAGAAYWSGGYWGRATTGGGAVSWATAGYIYGGGGYTYQYAGSANY